MADQIGSHHNEQIAVYTRYSKARREEQLKEIEEAVAAFKDTQLLEDDYTLEDVQKIIGSLTVVVKSSVQSELIRSAQQNIALLINLMAQAEKRGVWLDIDPSALDSGQLQAAAAAAERSATSPGGASGAARLPSLAKGPLEAAGDALKLREENRLLRERCAQLQQRHGELMHEVEALKAAASAPATPSPAPVPTAASAPAAESELRTLRDRLAAAEAAQAERQQELVALRSREAEATARADRLARELDEARKEAAARVSDTKQFQSLQKMLQSKTQQVKELRQRLSKYEPEEGAAD